MAEVIRHVGLSLGADLCWPICFEQMMKRLDLRIPLDGDTLRFDVERVTIEPFDLRQPCKYDVVVDRLTHWYATSRECGRRRGTRPPRRSSPPSGSGPADDRSKETAARGPASIPR